jgi:myo-inositol-1(or 4)-monophosphatase
MKHRLMNQDALDEMLKLAVAGARQAGQEALSKVGSAKATIKNNSELVTETDKRCQEIIVDRIGSAFPEHGFIGEEGDEGRLFKQRPKDPDGVWWVIDPIDGTNNFAHGMPQFSVSIGAMQHGHPLLGVIYHPATNTLYTACKSSPSREDDLPIQAPAQPLTEYANIGLDSHFGDAVPNWICQIMTHCRYRNLGTTALHLSYVAKGGYAAMIACTPKLWDIAAGALIAQNAGALVTDWQGNTIWPQDLAAYQGQALPIVVGAADAHQEIIELIGNE